MFATSDPNEPTPDAISAVKALQKASAAGQKIYQINQANLNQVLPLLNHDQATRDEITSALNTGKDVTTHTDAVSIPGGWSGFGYIITDPITGDGAYKISGGSNGSFLKKIKGFSSFAALGIQIYLIIDDILDVIASIKKCGWSGFISSGGLFFLMKLLARIVVILSFNKQSIDRRRSCTYA